MARVPYLSEEDLAPQNRDLLARKLNLYRALVHSPDSARHFAALGLHLRHHTRLDPRLRELAILQVGYLTRSPYEYAHHIELGRGVGISDEDIRAIAAETAGQTSALVPLERTVLSAARELTRDPRLGDETYTALAAHLDHERIVELVLTIAFYCAVVRVLGALEIDLEADYQHYLSEFPLPP